MLVPNSRAEQRQHALRGLYLPSLLNLLNFFKGTDSSSRSVLISPPVYKTVQDYRPRRESGAQWGPCSLHWLRDLICQIRELPSPPCLCVKLGAPLLHFYFNSSRCSGAGLWWHLILLSDRVWCFTRSPTWTRQSNRVPQHANSNSLPHDTWYTLENRPVSLLC